MSPHPKMNEYLVAFVDVLGFGDRVLAMDDDQALRDVHTDISILHDTFNKNPRDVIMEHENTITRRTVLALSDALIIATAFESPVSTSMGVFDNWCDEVHTLGINQAISAANGIFIRGGLSKGQFFFKNDILLSQAMVRAYKVEKDKAEHPIICLDDSTYKFFSNHPDSQYYSDEIQPYRHLFMEYKKKDGEVHYCIDYIRIGISAAYGEFTPTDREQWLAAPKNNRIKLRESIANDHAMKFLKHHKNAIEKELQTSKRKPDVEAKYLWLKEYHNTVANEWFPNNLTCLIP